MGRPAALGRSDIRTCCVCKLVKPIAEFGKNKGYPLDRSYCCYVCQPDWVRWRKLKSTFGMTKDTYQAMLQAQNGVCAICKQPERVKRSPDHSRPVNALAVDHDHKTNLVRGLLCHQCNIGIGNFQDSADRLELAAIYLRRSV